MKDYIKCEVCGKRLKVLNIAHLKTHNMTFKEYHKFVRNQKIKNIIKAPLFFIAGTLSDTIAELIAPFFKSLVTKVMIFIKALFKYKLIVSAIAVTTASTVIIYKIKSSREHLNPPRPPVQIQAENHQIPESVQIDSSKMKLTKLPLKSPIILDSQIIFRSQPSIIIDEKLNEMIYRYDFFDIERNKKGHGFINKFEVQDIKGQKIILDHASGLMWQPWGSGEMLFKDALDLIERYNEYSYAGFDDWRLPTLEEAMSLVESEQKNNDLYIDPIFDKASRHIWTIDKKPEKIIGLVISYFYGGCYDLEHHIRSYVRAVRSFQSSQEKEGSAEEKQKADHLKFRSQSLMISMEQAKEIVKNFNFYDYSWNKEGQGFTSQFEVKNDGSDEIILDYSSALMWQRSGSFKLIDYWGALNYISALNQNRYAGFEDWRLPTLVELMSLIEPVKNDSDLYIDLKFSCKQPQIWTCDSYGVKAWIVNFKNGVCASRRFDDFNYVRAVRSIKSSKK